MNWAQLCDLLQQAGGRLYGGEAVSQLQHALQAAYFAGQAGGDAVAVTAALLHDVGHLLSEQGDTDLAIGINDQHEALAVRVLKPLFGEAVCAPIALHVQAKRYLCFANADYAASLSPASQLSLQLQGGVMREKEAAQFMQQPYASAALALRRADDQAKIVDFPTPPLAHYLALAHPLCRAS